MKHPPITAAVAFAAVFSFGAVAGDSNVEARARASIEKAANWLVAQQDAEGGFWSDRNHPALTALPAWALSALNRDSDTQCISKAASFVRSCANDDGGIYVTVPGRRGGGLVTYNTAICMTALHYCDKANSVATILKAREYVAATQLLGDDEYRGGFGYEKKSEKPYADLNNSSWAMSAMRLTQDVEESRPSGEKKVDIDWDAALSYVEKMQVKPGEANTSEDDAGGFLYKRSSSRPAADGKAGFGKKPPAEKLADGTNGVPSRATPPKRGQDGKPMLRSYGSITYSGILSMIYAQVGRDDPRVVSAIDYARRHWTVDENPGMGQEGVYYYYTIMARALSLVDMDVLPPPKDSDAKAVAWRDDLLEKVMSLQKEDGSWSNGNNRFWESNPVLTTSYGILTMEYALRMFK